MAETVMRTHVHAGSECDGMDGTAGSQADGRSSLPANTCRALQAHAFEILLDMNPVSRLD